MRRLYAVCVVALFSILTLPASGGEVQNTVKDKFHVIEVDPFEIQKGVNLPPDYFASLQDELVKQLEESHQFKAVLRPQQPPPSADEPVLRLTGVVTGFKQGSRAKRYFGGFGTGAGQLIAHTRYIDRSTGDTVIEAEVIGTLTGGVFGGDSKNVIHDFAKAVVTTTKLTMLKPLSSERHEVTKTAESSVPAETKTLDISASDLGPGQQKLNELAAQGFRIVNYASTSNKSATLTLQKSADGSQGCEYRLLRTLLPGNLQKDLNKAAADGFRLVPHTVGFMKGYFLIAEKPAGPDGVRYEYRIHATVRVSSAEKNVKEDQAQGYVLIDTSQVLNNTHLIVLEREAGGQPPAS
jgi:hypothetical protein